MSFSRFLDFLGLGDTNNFPIYEQRREHQQNQTITLQKQSLNPERPLIKIRSQFYQKKEKIISSKKIIEVPQQLQYEVKQFQKERNWYIFPKDQPQKYKRSENCLPYCQSVETKFIFVTDYERFLPKSSHLYFAQLTNIILIQCKIDNVEAFGWLNAPQLRNIYLDKNYITSIKPLLKTTFCLSVLSFTENPIRDFDLSRFQMKKNSIGPNFCLFVPNLLKVGSPFEKLMKIQTEHLSLAVKQQDIQHQFYYWTKAFNRLEKKVKKLQFNPEGIRQLLDFQQSKFEYMYMQKVQRRKGNIFVVQQP